jgi:hypothetical protein
LAAIWFGGSSLSVSVTLAAKTVTVQVSSFTKSESGSSVNVRGPPLDAAVCAPLLVQEIENQLPLTQTSSLNVIVMFVPTATSTAPLAGVVLATDGAASPPVLSE